MFSTGLPTHHLLTPPASLPQAARHQASVRGSDLLFRCPSHLSLHALTCPDLPQQVTIGQMMQQAAGEEGAVSALAPGLSRSPQQQPGLRTPLGFNSDGTAVLAPRPVSKPTSTTGAGYSSSRR